MSYCICGGYLGDGGVTGYAGRFCQCLRPTIDHTATVSTSTISMPIEKEPERKLTNSEKIALSISKLMMPCPFCGHEAGIKGGDNGGIQCACMNADCGASLPSWLSFEKDENVIDKIALAVEYWNMRK